ncbi:MAG: hypothetical protein ACHQY2_04605, partial [Candidatus Eremiobacterales bacterium]
MRVASDAVIALVAALAAAALSVGLVPLQMQTVMSVVVTASLIVVALVITGTYRHRGAQLQEAALRLAAACACAAGVLSLFWLANANVFAPQVSVTAASLAFPMLLFARLWKPVRRRSAKPAGASRTIVVGARDAARAVIRLLD